MLHFRHFLLPALMVGAALFLPGNAFAEKNEHNGQPNSHKEMVQANNPSEKTETPAKQVKVLMNAKDAAKGANVPPKNENAMTTGKPVTVPEPARKNQQASNGAPKQAASQKPATAAPKALPDQAKGNGYGLNKTEKTVEAPGQEKQAAGQEIERELEKNKLTTHDVAVHSADITVNDKSESTRLVPKFEPQGEGSDLSNLNPNPKPFERFEFQQPVPLEKDNVPVSKEEIPKVDQAINPPQRSDSSGGQSNDRVSTGVSTISLIDKWFVWNKDYEMKLVQPYLSCYALMNSQWVNAPPSPPPQEAPFFKTVNRS
ncbi:hypothetical protein ACIQXV_01290 [Neobacillus sp. NPDC097160]|uniref:hypothetical protein n=1 Tax=Neobacillus sp. NPDC097160 TaxID=3364298 RepID=UPI0037F2171B